MDINNLTSHDFCYDRTTQTNVTITLAEEFTIHKDLVFRADWCQYIIDRHPEGITIVINSQKKILLTNPT